MNSESDFCIFILTHGRPDTIYTLKTLEKCGYTGKIFIVIDDEDDKADEYKELYGDDVLQFSKVEEAKTFDTGDNFDDRRTIVYARNVCFRLAKENGYEYFMQLDDDYTDFAYRFDHEGYYRYKKILNINFVISEMLNFLKNTNISSIAMAQGGDFIGGSDSAMAKARKLKRKCMNSFICSTDRPFKFIGRVNEDVNTYTCEANRGLLLFTMNNISLQQKETQSNEGGMSEMYLSSGTYVKSFYTVMFAPSCAKVGELPSKYRRLHHSINWNNAVPKILRHK